MRAILAAVLVAAILWAHPGAAAEPAAPTPAEAPGTPANQAGPTVPPTLKMPAGQLGQAGPAAQPTPTPQPIPFRKDDDLGTLAVNVGLGLAVAIGVGVAVLYALRRYLAGVQMAPGRRLRVIETVRLGPKAALVLVELDGRSILIGQHGDSLAVLDRPPAAAQPPSPADHAA